MGASASMCILSIRLLRHELMVHQPMIPSAPSQPVPERIIPAVEKSRPPVYSPELAALLTSPHSRMIKPLTIQQLRTPPKLPERADPKSEEARLYGRLSKRREVNIRWRHFSSNHKKVYPPLQVVYEEGSASGEVRRSSDKDTLTNAGVRTPGTQDTSVFEDVEALARPCHIPTTRREKQNPLHSARQVTDVTSVDASHRPKRRLRRAHQQLLSKLPILTYTTKQSTGPAKTSPGRFSVHLSEKALNESYRRPTMAVDERDLAWIAGT